MPYLVFFGTIVFTLFPRWSVKAGRGPEWELNRLKDPVTAEHDRRTGRSERYWRDMYDKTFKEKEDEMRSRVLRINTEQRLNLMAKKVRYARMTREDMLAYGRGSQGRRPRSGHRKQFKWISEWR